MTAYLYIMANQRNGTLYTGVTSDLIKRVYQHRTGETAGFTRRYKTKRLVHYEIHATAPLAIQREKNIKKWSRKWKLDLIERDNPD